MTVNRFLHSLSHFRLAILSAGALLLPGVATAQEAADTGWLRSSLGGWYREAARRAPGEWGIAVADQSGQMLWSVQGDQPMVPASTVKLFTTGFARSVLGGDARRPTRVVGTGHLDRATGDWVGTWALQLNGDVTLERDERQGPMLFDLAAQLAEAGIRRLSGPLVVGSADGPAVDEYPSVWSSRHRGRLFAPPIGPLTLNENVVYLTVRPGTKVGRRARLTDESPRGISSLISVTATTRSGSRSSLRLVPRKGGGWVLAGRIGVRSPARRLAAVASDPRVVLTAAWAAALERAGIRWSQVGYSPREPEGTVPHVLAEVTSPPLDSVASEVNRRSLNIGAELLLQWAAGRNTGPQSLMDHVRQVVGDSAEVHLVDGSGLSGEDRVAPSTFVSYLARFPLTPAGRNFPQLLPANGSGTLRRLNTGFPGSGVVRAKTGTLGNASTVVGYLGRPEGVLLVSLMYSGPRPLVARQEQWKLFRLLGANGVIIPSDTTEGPDTQLGGDEVAPKWWDLSGAPRAADSTAPPPPTTPADTNANGRP